MGKFDPLKKHRNLKLHLRQDHDFLAVNALSPCVVYVDWYRLTDSEAQKDVSRLIGDAVINKILIFDGETPAI